MRRYIDADKLSETIKEHSYLLSDSINSRNYGMFLDGIMQAIGEAPTADAQEVRHGRWNTINGRFTQCSVCGVSRDIRTQVGWNFCPVCGAKMDEEEHE